MNRAFPISGTPSFSITRTDPGHVRRWFGLLVVVALSVGLFLGTGTPAHADELDDQKKQLEAQIAQSKKDLEHANSAALDAQQQLLSSIEDLQAATAALKAAEAARDQAQAIADQAQHELAAARAAALAAQIRSQLAQQAVADWVKVISVQVQQSQQQNTDLIALGALINSASTGNAARQLQWTTTMIDATSAKYDRLTELKLAAEDVEVQAGTAQQQVAGKAAQAEQALAAAQAAQLAADQAAAAQQSAVAANEQAKAQADATVEAEKERQAKLQSESAAVSARIKARIEAAKRAAAAAAAKRAAEQAAAAKAAAAKAAADKAAAEKAAAKKANSASSSNSSSSSSSSKKSSSSSSSSSKKSSSKYFRYPVSGPITSSYGMRFHPVLRVWKLHDGTDFGAGCGTPIYAARAGVVSERYYNGGYGNRLMIDHGLVGGRYLTTGYNHAQYYVVGVGQRVSAGQVIGYVGSTGYSTGCHLHLMVWQDGNVVNPMIWF